MQHCPHRQNKLCLVLDLDHTLLNSARYAELDHDTATLLHHHYGEEQALRAPDKRELHQVLHRISGPII